MPPRVSESVIDIALTTFAGHTPCVYWQCFFCDFGRLRHRLYFEIQKGFGHQTWLQLWVTWLVTWSVECGSHGWVCPCPLIKVTSGSPYSTTNSTLGKSPNHTPYRFQNNITCLFEVECCRDYHSTFPAVVIISWTWFLSIMPPPLARSMAAILSLWTVKLADLVANASSRPGASGREGELHLDS